IHYHSGDYAGHFSFSNVLIL
ncbi:hypothetical protein AZ030_003578, partial [Escherichia coli]